MLSYPIARSAVAWISSNIEHPTPNHGAEQRSQSLPVTLRQLIGFVSRFCGGLPSDWASSTASPTSAALLPPNEPSTPSTSTRRRRS